MAGRYYQRVIDDIRLMWKQWVNATLGLAVLALPFLSLSVATFTWSLIIAGVAVAALSLWSIAEESSYEGVGRLAHR